MARRYTEATDVMLRWIRCDAPGSRSIHCSESARCGTRARCGTVEDVVNVRAADKARSMTDV